MAEVEDRVALTYLLDFYGPLLTEHRREIAALYCEEDMTLAEIADRLGITRQGVSDALGKARRQLTDYENKLGLCARYRAMCGQAEICKQALDCVRVSPEDEVRLAIARQALEEILRIER